MEDDLLISLARVSNSSMAKTGSRGACLFGRGVQSLCMQFKSAIEEQNEAEALGSILTSTEEIG